MPNSKPTFQTYLNKKNVTDLAFFLNLKNANVLNFSTSTAIHYNNSKTNNPLPGR